MHVFIISDPCVAPWFVSSVVSEPQARKAAAHPVGQAVRGGDNFQFGLLVNEMQTGLSATTTAHPVCTARGIPLGRKRVAGFNSLLQDRKQKATAQRSGCRQLCVHTRAVNSSSGSVSSTATRTQENSAPALAAASRSSHAQSDSQPQEATTPQQEITAVLDESKLRRESHDLQQAVPANSNAALQYLNSHKGARLGLYGAAILLGGTLLIAAFRVFRKYNTPQNKRKRNVSKNKLVVESLQEYLPNQRSALTPNVARSLKMKTGFNASEIFRKYLWYLLRERKFDAEAVNDVMQLKASLQLSDEEVSEAIQERAKRIYDKYGNVMLDVKGMTKAGVERKATCRALFSKLLYLAEYDGLLPQDTELAQKTNVPDVFGATQEDTQGLRIVSLEEIDMDKLEGQFDHTDAEEGDESS